MTRRIRIDPYPRGAKSKGTWILDSLTPYVADNRLHVRPEHAAVIDHLTGLKIRNGAVLGESPGLADSLAMHSKYWTRAIPRVAPADDIRDEDDVRGPVHVPTAYGLEPSKWQGGIAV
jgi:hypothetical protein